MSLSPLRGPVAVAQIPEIGNSRRAPPGLLWRGGRRQRELDFEDAVLSVLKDLNEAVTCPELRWEF